MDKTFRRLICFLLIFGPIYCKFELSSILSHLKIGAGAEIESVGTFNAQNGTVTFEESGTISGGDIVFDDGAVFASKDKKSVVEGSFTIYSSISPLDQNNLGNNKITFSGDSCVTIQKDLDLNKLWTCFAGTTQIQGNSNSIYLNSSTGKIQINAGATLELVSVNLFGVTQDTFDIVDSSSGLIVKDSWLSFSDAYSVAQGSLTFLGQSTLYVNEHDILLAETVTFTVQNNSALWLDNKGAKVTPIFSITHTTTSGVSLISLIDNTSVRVVTDKSGTIDPGLVNIISNFIDQNGGGSGGGGGGDPEPQVVTITQNTTLQPNQQVAVTNNLEIEGGGSTITSSGSNIPQVVVGEGNTLTIGNIEFLRISQNTFSLAATANMRFKNPTVLEFIEDVVYDKGHFSIIGDPGNVVLIRGLGGRKKLEFKDRATWNIGVGNFILEDMEIVGFDKVFQEKRSVGGVNYEGKVIMAGGAKINILFDSSTNISIRGSDNRINLQNTGLNYSGKLRFENGYDSALSIGFGLSPDIQNLTWILNRGAVELGSSDGTSTMILDSDDIQLINKSSSSFVVRGRSFLGGQRVTVVQNPITQETSDFTLLPGLELLANQMNPIEIADHVFEENRGVAGMTFKGETTRAISVPKASLTIRGGGVYSATNLSKSIGLRPGANLTNFSSNPSSRLQLLLSSNTKISFRERRDAQLNKFTAQVIRDGAPTVSDESFFDYIKSSDELYVSGTENIIKVTGNLVHAGTMIFDEKAELVFEFDDGVDSEKSILFTGQNNRFFQEMPPSSSIVFKGRGTVYFSADSRINFNGSPLDSNNVSQQGVILDNRPSLIFRDYCKMSYLPENTGAPLMFNGNGKLLFLNGSQLVHTQGVIKIGDTQNSFFDVACDQGSGVVVGVENLIQSSSPVARISFPYGLVNLRFEKSAFLNINNGGLFEIGLDNGAFKGGSLIVSVFTDASKLLILPQGQLSLAQTNYSTLAQTTSQKHYWNNLAGIVQGSGSVGFYTENGPNPFVLAKLQPQQFLAQGNTMFDTFKNLVRITSALTSASDYIDTVSGTLKLLTSQGVIVSLRSGDVVQSESLIDGTVFGESSSGRQFGILANGTRESFG